jgi:hypothetical protein
MDQHSPDTLPSVELPNPQPAPSPETAPQTDAYSEQVDSKQLEQAPTNSPDPTASQQLSQSISPSPVPMAPHTEPAEGASSIAVTPQFADDTDLIEKEWVDRAKRIVEHTRNDPHQQTKEMSNMKADYLKKRYNKDTKLSE